MILYILGFIVIIYTYNLIIVKINILDKINI
jgi:hypothetical protein